MSSLTYTILVAEDDDSIRHALTDVLTASGYEVLAAEEGLDERILGELEGVGGRGPRAGAEAGGGRLHRQAVQHP